MLIRYSKIIRKPSLHLIVQGRLFCYAFYRKRGDFVTIEEYIKSKPKFELMPFATIYVTIMELIDDGFIEETAFKRGDGSNVEDAQPKPERKVCWGLYSSGDYESNR